MKIAVLIATRLASKRIKNKSLKNFGRQNLTYIKLLQAKRVGVFDKLYFSSDSLKLNNYAKKLGYEIILRPKKYLGDSTISKFGPFLANKISVDNICYLTNTSPLISDQTIIKAVKIYKKLNKKKYDSISTFEKCNSFLWNENKPINYSVNKQPRSQDLKNIYIFNPALAIMSKKKILEFNNVCGKKPYKFIIQKPESIDIDTIYDLHLAKIYKRQKI